VTPSSTPPSKSTLVGSGTDDRTWDVVTLKSAPAPAESTICCDRENGAVRDVIDPVLSGLVAVAAPVTVAVALGPAIPGAAPAQVGSVRAFD